MPILKKSRHIIYFSLVFSIWLTTVNSFAQAPSWVWAKGVHTNVAEWATDVAVDTSTGEIVVVGIFNSDLSAYYGLRFVGAIGGGFVAKYDAAGNVLWAFPIGNNQDDACNGVAVAPSGNIYVTGYLQNIADFKGTSLASTILTSAGGKDIFIAKYNPAGQLQWVRQAGGVSDDEGYAICTNTNTLFVTGYFTNSGNFSGTPTVSNKPTQNLFVTSYDASGNVLWLTDGGSGQSTYGRDIIADNNNVYVTGDFKNASLGIYDISGANVANMANVNSVNEDAYVMSLAVAGPFNWIKGIQSSGRDFGRGIAQNTNGIYVTGSISSSAVFAGYSANPVNTSAVGLDMFLAQLVKTTGNTNWVNSEKGPSDEEGISVCIDTANTVSVGGYFQTSWVIGGGPTINSSGNQDVFLNAYSDAGVFKWVMQAGDVGVDIPHGIATTATGEIYVAGEYENNAVFGSNVLTADSPPNIFLAKVGCVPLSNNSVAAAQTICAGQVPSPLTGSSPVGGISPYIYLWQQSANNIIWSAASGTNNTQNYSPPALLANTYFRRVVISIAGCSGSDTSNSILITVNQKPTVANAGVDSSICNNTTNMWGNMPAVGTATWTLVSGGGTIVNPNSPTTTVNGLSTGLNVFVWTISNGVCPNSSDTVKVKVDAFPTIANAGTDQAICSSTYTLNGNPALVGTGVWSVITGSATVTSPSSPNSAATGLSVGQNIFVWAISNGSCSVSRDTVTISVDAMPSISFAGNPQTICSSSYTLNASAPFTGTGTWNVLSGGSIVTNPLQNNSAVTGLSIGTNNLEWVVSNGSCPASRDTVTITVDAMPSAAVAGTDQTICSSTYTLNASAPTIGTGTWSAYSGGATVVTPSAINSVANNLSTGNNIFIWTVTNGVCPSSSDSVTIAVDAIPSTAVAGNPITLCHDSIILNATIPTVGTATWSVVSGGATIANASQNNSLVYNLSTGSNIFMWSVGNGVCPVSTSTVVITVDANPSPAFAGSDQPVCGTSFTLSATAPVTGTGTWSVLSGGGTVATPTANVTGASGLSFGINSFVWTVSNGTCPASKDTIQITAYANPSIADAGNPQAICSSSTILNAVVPVVGTGMWNVISGGATVASPTQNNSTVNNLATGLNAIEWVVSNGVCNPTRDTVYITVDANPSVAAAGTDQTICRDSSSLLANTPVTGTGAWTVVAGGGTVNFPSQPSTPVINLTTGPNFLVWTISNGTCPSSTDTVIIHVDAMPSLANAGISQNVCSTSANLNAVIPAIGTGIWTVTQGTSSVVSPSSNNSAVNGLSSGINIFQWTVSNGICPSNSDTVVIKLNSPPSNSNAGTDQAICALSTSLSAIVPTVGNGAWSVFSGGGIINAVNSFSTTVNNLSTGQNIFIWTVSNGVCPPSTDSVIITVSQFPSAANAGIDQNVCINTATAILNAVIPSVGSGVWSLLSGTGTISNPNQNNSGVNSLSLGQNTFVWTVTNSLCPSSKDTVSIFVLPDPTTANAGPDVTIFGTSTNLNANTPVIGTGSWSLVSGSGIFANSTNPSTQVSGLSFGDNIFGWTISNGVCPNSYDEVIIHVNDLMVPNGFSPNGDHVNDNFEIQGIDLFNNVKLEVFNRWGNLVYENSSYKNDWDGKNLSGEDLTDDTYYFTLTITSSKTYKGFVVLKRK